MTPPGPVTPSSRGSSSDGGRVSPQTPAAQPHLYVTPQASPRGKVRQRVVSSTPAVQFGRARSKGGLVRQLEIRRGSAINQPQFRRSCAGTTFSNFRLQVRRCCLRCCNGMVAHTAPRRVPCTCRPSATHTTPVLPRLSRCRSCAGETRWLRLCLSGVACSLLCWVTGCAAPTESVRLSSSVGCLSCGVVVQLVGHVPHTHANGCRRRTARVLPKHKPQRDRAQHVLRAFAAVCQLCPPPPLPRLGRELTRKCVAQNKRRNDIITVCVDIREGFNTLRCRATPIEYDTGACALCMTVAAHASGSSLAAPSARAPRKPRTSSSRTKA